MSEQFQCRFCPQSYKEVIGFLDHFETHMNQNQKETKQNELLVCGKSINDEKTQKEQMHVKIKNEDVNNDICDENSKRSTKYENEKQSHEFHQCKTCNKKFKLKIQFMDKSGKISIWMLKQVTKKNQNLTNATHAIKVLEESTI